MWQSSFETPVWIQAAYVGVVGVIGLGLVGIRVVDEMKQRITQRRAEEQRRKAEAFREVQARVIRYGFDFTHKADATYGRSTCHSASNHRARALITHLVGSHLVRPGEAGGAGGAG